MPLETLENGKSFLEQRTKINAAVDEINSITDGTSSGGIPITAIGTTTPRTLGDWHKLQDIVFDSYTDAINDTKLSEGQKVTTKSFKSKSQCDSLFIGYPDGRGSKYIVDSLGGLKELPTLREKWADSINTVMYKMYTRQTVNFGFYGDSIIAGLGTPSYSGLNSVGTNYINPEAFCVRMKEVLEKVYGTTVNTWNAGYSGQGILTGISSIPLEPRGFAYKNIDAAMFENPFYGDPDILFIHFGLNDISDPIGDLDEIINRWVNEFEYIIADKLYNRSALPVLLTTSVISQSFNRDTATRDNEKAQGAINNAIKSIGSKYGLPVIDLNSIMKDWFNKNQDEIRQNNIIFDFVHPNEEGHKFIGGAIASKLIRDILEVKSDAINRVNFQDSRYHYNHNSTANVIIEANQSRYGIHPNLSAGSYTAGEVLSFIDVWCESENTTLILRGFANYGQSGSVAQTDLARIKVYSYQDLNTPYFDEAMAGAAGFLPLQNTDVDRPYRLCKLKYGYNRIELIAPQVTTTSVQMGYFEFSPKIVNQNSGKYLTGGTVYTNYWQTNALCESGECYFTVDGITDTQTFILPPESLIGSNIMDFGIHGDTVDLLLECKLDLNTGITFLGGKSYTDTDNFADNAVILYRNGVSSLRLALYRKSGILNLNNGTSSAIDLTNPVQLLIRCTKDATTGVQTITVFDSWAASSSIITWSSSTDQANRTVPYSGVAAGAWLSDSIGGGVKELRISKAMIRNYNR